MSDTNTPGAAPQHGHPALRRAPYRLAFTILAVAGAASIVLLPFGVTSLVHAFANPATSGATELGHPASLRGEWTRLNIAAVAISEATPTMTLRVSGFHRCPGRCPLVERVHLFSLHADPAGALGAPPSVVVDLPSDSSEVEEQVTLPITGDLSEYPFDHYHLLLGVTISKVVGSREYPLAPAAARAGLAYTVDSDIPRVALNRPLPLNPARYDNASVDYVDVTALSFYRPFYLRMLAILLTVLIILAAAYAVLFRPFTQIVPTIGGIVLSIWGVRSLLVGSYPPDSTGVDLILEGAILLLLIAIALRGASAIWPHTGFRQRPTETKHTGEE